jgi:Fe2+ transport system protein FeoA
MTDDTANTISLENAVNGKTYRVCGLDGGEDFKLRLKNLGIVVGRPLTRIHSHPFRGPVTVKVHHSKVAIGHGMARRILLEEVVEEK